MLDMTTIILHDTKKTVENAQENKIWIFRNLKVWFGTKEITAYELNYKLIDLHRTKT